MTTTFKAISRIPSEEQIEEDFQSSRIYRAIRKGESKRVLTAINRGANIHLYDHEQLFTFLHLVVIMANTSTEEKYLPMIYILSNYGVEINAHDVRGRTALELAIHKELPHIMVALIRVGTDLTDRDYKSMIHRIHGEYQPEMLDYFDKYEPGLWGAVKRNNISQVQLLLNSWCRVNTVKNNKTLIEYASLTRKPDELIATLSESQVCLEFVHATLAGDQRLMREFLGQEGCDPHTMDISYHDNASDMLIPRSLTDTAIAMGHMHILALLPSANNNNDDSKGNNLDDDVTEHDILAADYPESNITPSDVTTKTLRLGLTRLDLEDSAGQCVLSHNSDYDDKLPTRKQSQKYKNRSSQKAESSKRKNKHVYPADEGYNSTVSSIQSISTNQSESDNTRFDMGYGQYKKYYENCYYYTSAPADDNNENNTDPMLVLNTPRGMQSSRRNSKAAKGSSVKSKGKKQRARIYWQDENREGDAIPVAKPRSRSKRTMSMKMSRKYDVDDDTDPKSRMCVIQ